MNTGPGDLTTELYYAFESSQEKFAAPWSSPEGLEPLVLGLRATRSHLLFVARVGIVFLVWWTASVGGWNRQIININIGCQLMTRFFVLHIFVS